MSAVAGDLAFEVGVATSGPAGADAAHQHGVDPISAALLDGIAAFAVFRLPMRRAEGTR